jgi:D-glucosaminate-specific PTS system IID component
MSEAVSENRIRLTQADLNKAFLKWYVLAETSNSYERLQTLAFCACLSHILKKLYPKKEDLVSALQRHMTFYNSEGTFGCLIHGVTCSMEEERANGTPIPDEAITGFKTGLMGPLAGIGDTLTWGTWRPIVYGLSASFAFNGNALGAIVPWLFPILPFVLSHRLWMMGYNFGRNSIRSLLQSGMINEIITGSSIMGLFMMGALGSSYVRLSIPLAFKMENSEIVIQKILDDIAPGLLPLSCILIIYFFFKKKGQNFNLVIISIIIISLIGSLIGLF